MGKFSGILPYTPISVDFFASRRAKTFFLSHFHADHYTGLQNGFSLGPIYCTEITKRLMLNRFKIDESLIMTLDYGPHTIPILPTPMVQTEIYDDILAASPPEETSVKMNVTLFPANHCPGACMILFEGYFGRYLYTGDFRYDSDLHDETVIACCRQVDRLFVDTTFIDPHWNFPPKLKSIEEIIRIVRSELKSQPKCQVFLECSMLGTENILLAVATHFRSLIHVDDDKFNKLSCIDGLADILTTDPSKTQFHACRANALAAMVPKRKEILSTPTSVRRQNTERRSDSSSAGPTLVRYHQKTFGDQRVEREMLKPGAALFIKPSSQWFGSISDEKVKLTKQESPISHFVDGIWHVLSSIHSSASEIQEFVRRIQPRRIIPLVESTDSALKNLMKLCKPGPHGNSRPTIPKSIESAMEALEPRTVEAKRAVPLTDGDPPTKRAKFRDDEVPPWSVFDDAPPPSITLPPESREGSQEEDDDEIEIDDEQENVTAIPAAAVPSEPLMNLEAYSQLPYEADDDLLNLSMPAHPPHLKIEPAPASQEQILNLTMDNSDDMFIKSNAPPSGPQRSMSLIYDDSSN